MSSRSGSPRKRSGMVSPTYDDASVFGSSSTYGSVVGHDDPTAVMGNLVRTGSSHTLRSIGTIKSFVTTTTTEHESETEVREPLEDIREAQAPDVEAPEALREQLEELDRTADEWQARQPVDPAPKENDVESFYVHEVGDYSEYNASSTNRKHTDSGAIEKPQSDASDMVGNGGAVALAKIKEIDAEKSRDPIKELLPLESVSETAPLHATEDRSKKAQADAAIYDLITNRETAKEVPVADKLEPSQNMRTMKTDKLEPEGVPQNVQNKRETKKSDPPATLKSFFQSNKAGGLHKSQSEDESRSDSKTNSLMDGQSSSYEATDRSRGSGYVSSDQSYMSSERYSSRSVEQQSSVREASSIETSSKHECSTHSTTIAIEAQQIIRLVQQRLAASLEASSQKNQTGVKSHELPVVPEKDQEISGNTPKESEKPVSGSNEYDTEEKVDDDGHDLSSEPSPSVVKESPPGNSLTPQGVGVSQYLATPPQEGAPEIPQNSGKEPTSPERTVASFPPYIPTPEGTQQRSHGPGLATQQDLSDDDDDFSIGESRYAQRRRRRVLIPCLILLLIAAIILGLVFALDDNEEELSRDGLVGTPTAATTTSPTREPTVAPAPEPTSQPASQPTFQPTFQPTVSQPTSQPVSQPTSQPTSKPTSQPTSSPTALVTETARDRLTSLSGDLIDDPNSPQSEAYDWLVNQDPANLKLDDLSDKELIQRYLATLLYFSTDGENWDDSYGFLGEGDVCLWQDSASGQGITCDSSGNIVDLSINENSLSGPLPFELSALTSLQKVEFRSNNLIGSIPPEFGRLTALEEFDLRQNQLKGTFPQSVFELPNLRKLLLLRNEALGGTIPESIDRASNLEMISFQRCQLTGSIPTTIGSLSKLHFITILDNGLSGSLPSELMQLPLLEVMELAGNDFTGSIPDFNGQQNLYFVSLQGNELSGSLPASIGGLAGLLFLDVTNNKLSGSIPSAINQIPELVTFSAANNELTGTVPSFSGNEGLLQAIDLSRNNMTGNLNALFAASGPARRLQTINFSFNSLSGSIPSTIGSFTELADVLLDRNNLTGTIPDEIGNLTLASTISIKENNLEGNIPFTMGNLESLTYLDLGGNNLNGTLPASLGMLGELMELDLSHNLLSGQVPSSLSMLGKLGQLYLERNLLTGDLNTLFCPDGESSSLLTSFVADCGQPEPEVTCSCCTSCCSDNAIRCPLRGGW